MATEKQQPDHDHGRQAESTSDYYRRLFEGAGFAIIGADCDGVIINCNRAAQKLLETAPADLLGKALETIVPAERRPALQKATRNALRQGMATELEVDRRLQSGEDIRLAVVIGPVLDSRSQPMGLAAWVRDITNRKILQEQLLQAEKMASLGTLASGVAHHFNNIIGGVATFVDYALHSDNPQASRRALQMAAEAAHRIGQLTQSLLTFAEKDLRQFDLSDLTEVVLTFGHLVEKPLAEHGIKLKMELHRVPLYAVPGSRIHQVLGNLLDNAERAMPEGGSASIALEQEPTGLRLTFTDTGCGIEADDLPHIFEPFFTTRGLVGGGNQPCAGLGLSVVHGIMRELGGTISVQSDPGMGTTFEMHFPFPSKYGPNAGGPEGRGERAEGGR